MRYFTEPLSIVKSCVRFTDPVAATAFYHELLIQKGVYDVEKLGTLIKYWCTDRSHASGLAVDFERRWIEKNHPEAILKNEKIQV